MKRLISILVATLLLTGICCFGMENFSVIDTALANDYCTIGEGYVISKNASLRVEPKESSKKLCDVMNGEEFDIISELSDWYYVMLKDGTIGYIHSWYVMMNPKIIYLCEGGPVYAAPGVTNKRVGYVSAGDKFVVIAETDNYYIINLRTASGYLPKSTNVMSTDDYQYYFSFNSTKAKIATQTQVRMTASNKAKALGKLNAGDDIIIHACQEDFYAIEYWYGDDLIIGFVKMSDVIR